VQILTAFATATIPRVECVTCDTCSAPDSDLAQAQRRTGAWKDKEDVAANTCTINKSCPRWSATCGHALERVREVGGRQPVVLTLEALLILPGAIGDVSNP